MDWGAWVQSPFVWGLLLGLLFFVISAWSHFKTKREFGRYRKHLSDKLDLDASQLEALKKERDGLLKENENLRLKVGMMAERSDQKILRDLEILTRAEKRMVVRAPGFAPAWESAKAEAADEIAHEEMGKSLPKRFFNRLFGNSTLKMLDAGAHAEPTASESSDGGQTPAGAAGNSGASSKPAA